MYHNCGHCVHYAKGKKWQRQLTYHLFSLITGIETNMLLIILLGLIGNLALVSGDCDLGTPTLNDFDFSSVGISVLISLL
jgi:hypothetical protein